MFVSFFSAKEGQHQERSTWYYTRVYTKQIGGLRRVLRKPPLGRNLLAQLRNRKPLKAHPVFGVLWTVVALQAHLVVIGRG